MTTQHAPKANKHTLAHVLEVLRYGFTLAGEKKLTQAASSLTYTTVLALVPLLAVILSLFTAFPLFADFKQALEEFLSTSLMPPAVSETVMGYLNQFAAQASGLTAIGTLFLIVVSVMLIMTIDDVLNDIWSVRRQRPLRQRLLVYWAILSLGPVLAGASLWSTAYLARESLGLINMMPTWLNLVLSLVPAVIAALGFGALFMFVPNCQIRWRDALIGGIWTALVLTVMKSGFAFYITRFPSYTVIYGTFATLPIFLLWIYLSWLGILSGALIAALLPALRLRHWEHLREPGSGFLAALKLLRLLRDAQGTPEQGYGLRELSTQLQTEPDALRQVLESLRDIGWVALAQGTGSSGEIWVLSSNLAQEKLSRLVDAMLVSGLYQPEAQSLRHALAASLRMRYDPTVSHVLDGYDEDAEPFTADAQPAAPLPEDDGLRHNG
ncbi:YihY family inner membrane protein [Pusillimonas sp. CC-YST705]|uniref:UPF0761 membrane protein H0484_04385 n=1 Tax=Mesopusillimonas faecipullorum TaxID=2755040 RepID=A0ABS8CAD0_9BURK|nr:YihY family inner membrane protein [Mesopusillimonas faecipullorum]MCB5362991.1 YihY family inner membrane protein [Mesopusillimonas faecipullorum]